MERGSDVTTGIPCAICLQVIVSGGVHRPASLPCGHLYGFDCIITWMNRAGVGGAFRCPRCSQQVKREDIRILYLDTTVVPSTTPETFDNGAQEITERDLVELYNDPEALRREIETIRGEIVVARTEFDNAMVILQDSPPCRIDYRLRLNRARAKLNNARARSAEAKEYYDQTLVDGTKTRAFLVYALTRLNKDLESLVKAVTNKEGDIKTQDEIKVMWEKVRASKAEVEMEERRVRVVDEKVIRAHDDLARDTQILNQARGETDSVCTSIEQLDM